MFNTAHQYRALEVHALLGSVIQVAFVHDWPLANLIQSLQVERRRITAASKIGRWRLLRPKRKLERAGMCAGYDFRVD